MGPHVAGVEGIAFPFDCLVIPRKIGSSWLSTCWANVVTCEFVAFVVYGFDCANDLETFAPGYATKIPEAWL